MLKKKITNYILADSVKEFQISQVSGKILSTQILILLRKIRFHYSSFLECDQKKEKKEKAVEFSITKVFIITLNFRKESEKSLQNSAFDWNKVCNPLRTLHSSSSCCPKKLPLSLLSLLITSITLHLSHAFEKKADFI